MKRIICLLFIVLGILVFISCKDGPESGDAEPVHVHVWNQLEADGQGVITYECQSCHTIMRTYAIGSKGPAGGIVFYDCDADNNTGNADGLFSSECGWRYLEAAPNDLFLLNGYNPSVNLLDPDYMDGEEQFYFGYVSDFYASNDTGTAIGTGKANTDVCWECMRDVDVFISDPRFAQNYSEDLSFFRDSFGKPVDLEKTNPLFPIQLTVLILCKGLNFNGYADWFLPSRDEMRYLFDYLDSSGNPYLAKNGFYWTSSAAASDSIYVIGNVERINTWFNPGRIRPIRAFSGIGTECDHDYVETTVPSTCTDYGYTHYVCKNCGYSYATINAKPLGHDFELIIGEITKCKTCGTVLFGPAGGYIIYDCDSDNDIGNPDGLNSSECGWRFIEVSPTTLGEDINFGQYRKTPDGKNLYSNGSIFYSEGGTDKNDGKCTGKKVGTGKANTEKLVAAMGDNAYINTGLNNGEVNNVSSNYAAKLCADYEINGYSDWFLPSIDELYELMSFLQHNVIMDFILTTSPFWSSSEDATNKDNAYFMVMNSTIYSENKAPGLWDDKYVLAMRYVSE